MAISLDFAQVKIVEIGYETTLYLTEGHQLNQDAGIPCEFGKADS